LREVTHHDEIKVWDLGVRVFHWSLVGLFCIAYLTGDEHWVHVYSGYGIIALLVFRAVWGLIGPKYARFSNFIYGRATTKAYARSLLSFHPTHYLGHNPLGGWMVVLLLIALSLTTWTGLEAYGAKGHGPLAAQWDAQWNPTLISTAQADDDGHSKEGSEEREKEDDFWEDVHELCANFTLFLVLIHIAGVLVSSVLHGENLIRAMITGYKKRP
jgi:cytochrome b